MHESRKIAEAAYFLVEMQRVHEDREPFVYVLSAFLSSARSVLLYAYEETKSKGVQSWYDKQVAQSKVVHFLRDKRNLTVHEEPVEPRVRIEQHMRESFPLHLSESLTAVMLDQTGKVIETRHAYSQPSEPARAPEPTVTRQAVYRFDDWNGPEDVLTLCRRYLDDVTAIVRDGQAKGFLTI